MYMPAGIPSTNFSNIFEFNSHLESFTKLQIQLSIDNYAKFVVKSSQLPTIHYKNQWGWEYTLVYSYSYYVFDILCLCFVICIILC